MNKKIGFFGRLWRIIDRKIIVPVTRFLMSFVRWFSNSNKASQNRIKWINRNWMDRLANQ